MGNDDPPYDWSGARGRKWLACIAGMEATLAPADEPLIRALDVRIGERLRVADIACGGGGTTIAIGRAGEGTHDVRGFDVSAELVAYARTRGSEIPFAVADVSTARPDRPFDRLCSRFGVMFFADPPAAFANLRSWLRPGGRFAFAVWGPLAENEWMSVVREVVAGVVELPRSDPDAPGPYRYADEQKLVALLTGAGFERIESRPLHALLPVGGALSPADAASFALASQSTFDELLARAGDDARRAAHAALTARFADHVHDGAVSLPSRVTILTGY